MMAPLEFEDFFIITESKRIKFIHYKLSNNNSLLTYGACVYKSLSKSINMTQFEITNHKNTAYQRFLKKPVIIRDQSIIDRITNNKMYFIRLLCKYGVKGRKPITPCTTPSPHFNRDFDVLEIEKNFKFGKNVNIKSHKQKLIRKYVSNSSIDLNSPTDHIIPEFKKFKVTLDKCSKRYRYISNEREIFIIYRYDVETGNIQYGASIFKKLFPDERITKDFAEKHFETALERLVKCPVILPFYKFIEKNNSFDFIDEDIMEELVEFILFSDNGKKRIKVSGERNKITINKINVF